jgi:hypothetical protein
MCRGADEKIAHILKKSNIGSSSKKLWVTVGSLYTKYMFFAVLYLAIVISSFQILRQQFSAHAALVRILATIAAATSIGAASVYSGYLSLNTISLAIVGPVIYVVFFNIVLGKAPIVHTFDEYDVALHILLGGTIGMYGPILSMPVTSMGAIVLFTAVVSISGIAAWMAQHPRHGVLESLGMFAALGAFLIECVLLFFIGQGIDELWVALAAGLVLVPWSVKLMRIFFSAQATAIMQTVRITIKGYHQSTLVVFLGLLSCFAALTLFGSMPLDVFLSLGVISSAFIKMSPLRI